MEKIVLDFLNEQFVDIPCYMEEPIEKPTEYFIVNRTGSNLNNMHRSGIVIIQSYSTSLYNAYLLNDRLKETMKLLEQHPSVSRVHLNTDYNYTDTTKKKYRYQAIYQIDFL